MKVEVRNRLLSTSIAILMLTSGLVMLVNTKAASVTNNNAPEVLVPPGAKNLLVANFTLNGTWDESIAGIEPNPGVELTTDNPWSDVYLYDDGDNTWEEDSDAIWQDDGNVYYDAGIDTHIAGVSDENTGPGDTTNPWSGSIYFYDGGTSGVWEEDSDAIWQDNGDGEYNSADDTLIAGTAPVDGTTGTDTNPWPDIYFYDDDDSSWNAANDAIWQDDGNVYYDAGIDTHIAGVSDENTGRGTTTNPWASADKPVAFYDDGDDTWDDTKDWIGLDVNADGVYDEFIKEIRVENTGTATTDEILGVNLWLDDGDGKFDPSIDPFFGSFIPTSEKTWTFSSYIPIWSNQLLFFVSADISTIGPTFSLKRNTIKMKVEMDIVSSPNVTLSFTNKYTQKIVILGVTYFEGNQSGPADVIATDTKDIKYGATVTLKINTSSLEVGEEGGATYYLYYPHYKKTGSGGSYTYDLEWLPYYYEDVQPSVTVDESGGIKEMTVPVDFNVSGMWVLDNDAPAESFDTPGGEDGNYAYFWVNGTEAYSVDISKTEVTYGKNETVKVTITEDGSTPSGVWVDVRKESDEYVPPVLRKYTTNGTVTFTVDTDDFLAGNYTIFVYRDLDVAGVTNNYDEDDGITGHPAGYTDWYGIACPDLTDEEGLTNYYQWMGTFDPPEKISAVKKIVVKTGKPTLEIPDANKTMYWNFSGEVKVIIKGYDGKNLSLFNANNVKVYNSEGDEVTDNLTIEPTTGSSHIIKIRPGPSASGWGRDDNGYIWGINGTWEVVVSYDKPTADGIEEWNGSVTFTVTSAPDVQIKILNPEDKEIKVVPCNASHPFFDLRFSVINKNHESLGGSGSEDEKEKAEKNITIYGDALFIGEEGKTLAEYKKICPFAVDYIPPSDGSDGIWSVKIIPLMDLNGGDIKIKVNWENTTKEETIHVGGTKHNGTIVTITPSEFTIDENVTLTVKVTDASGYAYPNAFVVLYYFNNVTGSIITDKPINQTSGGGTTSGEYTFLFNVSQQTDNQTAIFGEVKAPRYIIAWVGVPNVGCGYAYAVMKPRSDLKVEISRDTFMAGKPYHFWINVSTIDPITGNKTGTPADSGLHVRIYNETGTDVTDTIGSLTKSKLDDSASIELSSEYFKKPGTYTIYAYNNTHDSEGFNATIHVIPVEVTCDKSEFIWRVDNNITATFTVTWQGQPVNGTLKLYNITDVGKYNRTWANYTAGGNDTIELEVVNGVATLHDITAEYLPEGKGSMNITFEFKPEESGVYAKAKGVVLVKVPDATPTPDKVAIGETATVNVLVTGRGQPLSGVNVTLKGAGINQSAVTKSDGIATFSFLPGSTGNISILIENRSTGETIEVTAKALEIEIPASVAEGTFTITVKDEKGNPVEGAYVKFTGTGETKTTNSEGKVTFNITIPGTMPYATYKLIATKAGYRSDEETITIANVFNLYITAPSKLSAGQKLTVKVTSDTGPVYGVTVTIKKGEEVIDTKTLTGPEGVTFTIPKVKEKTTFTIIAEKEGFNPATYEITVSPAGIPGFELITLLAAIGIAIILLRKKKQ